MREIHAPIRKWRNLQRKLAYVLTLKYSPKVCAYGFVKDKNILGNASRHIKKSEILNIDLKDFFTQFHFGRIVGMLKAKPYYDTPCPVYNVRVVWLTSKKSIPKRKF